MFCETNESKIKELNPWLFISLFVAVQNHQNDAKNHFSSLKVVLQSHFNGQIITSGFFLLLLSTDDLRAHVEAVSPWQPVAWIECWPFEFNPIIT